MVQRKTGRKKNYGDLGTTDHLEKQKKRISNRKTGKSFYFGAISVLQDYFKSEEVIPWKEKTNLSRGWSMKG